MLRRFFGEPFSARTTNGNAELAVGTTVGPYRDRNEDRAAVVSIRFARDFRPRIRVAMVCDGMGGLVDGAGAATEAVSAFISILASANQGPLSQIILNAVLTANKRVFERLQGKGGTTLTAIVDAGHEVWCAHVGDSRLYNFGSNRDLMLFTRDDTIHGVVGAHQGGVSDEDELDNRLLQFVGVGENLSPHIVVLPRQQGGIWFVTSDGAHGIGRKTLESMIERIGTPIDLVRKMVFVADALNVKDNASVAALLDRRDEPSDRPLNGTVVSVSSPSRSIEIWVSQAIGDMRDEPQVQLDADKDRAPSSPERAKTVQRKSSSKPRKPRRSKPKAQTGSNDKPPMEVIFESGKADDERPA